MYMTLTTATLLPVYKKGLMVIYVGFKPYEQHGISQGNFEGIFPTFY